MYRTTFLLNDGLLDSLILTFLISCVYINHITGTFKDIMFSNGVDTVDVLQYDYDNKENSRKIFLNNIFFISHRH